MFKNDLRRVQPGTYNMERSSFLTTVLIVVAFTLGVLGSNLFRSVFGLLFRLNHRKSLTENTHKQTEKLPDLPPTVPKHVAVIMDGNRRFGRLKHADALQGHWVGGQTLVDFIQWCMLDGIEIATVYAFSTENWNRDPSEVNTLMSIFAKYAESLTVEASTRNVRVRIFSTDFQKLPPKVRSAVRELEKETAQCTGFLVNICLSYGSRAEIVMACNAAVAEKYEIEQCRINREHMSSIGGVEIAKCKAKKIKCGVREASSTSTTSSTSVGEENDCAASPPADCTQGPNSSSTIEALGLEVNREDNHDDVNSEFTEIENHIGTTDPGERGCSSSSSSSSSSRGGDLGPGSELSSVCKSSKFCDAHQKTCVKFLELDDEILSRHMCTAHIPDPDILIRTSGEYRISNFLLWQMAYTEMFFIDKLWPEVTHQDLRLVLRQFYERRRRFGV